MNCCGRTLLLKAYRIGLIHAAIIDRIEEQWLDCPLMARMKARNDIEPPYVDLTDPATWHGRLVDLARGLA